MRDKVSLFLGTLDSGRVNLNRDVTVYERSHRRIWVALTCFQESADKQPCNKQFAFI
jgi:hypothetical protein